MINVLISILLNLSLLYQIYIFYYLILNLNLLHVKPFDKLSFILSWHLLFLQIIKQLKVIIFMDNYDDMLIMNIKMLYYLLIVIDLIVFVILSIFSSFVLLTKHLSIFCISYPFIYMFISIFSLIFGLMLFMEHDYMITYKPS